MTLDEIAAIDKEFLTPKEVAPYLGVEPYSINNTLKHGGVIPWAYRIGTRAIIPKTRFVMYHSGVDMKGEISENSD